MKQLILTVIKRSLLPHELGDGHVILVQEEHILLRHLGQELALPEALEVYGIGQDGVGVLVDGILGQEVANVAARHVAHPVVDGETRRLGIRLEVGALKLVAEKGEHAVAQLLAAAQPQAVGHRELVVRRRIDLRNERRMRLLCYSNICCNVF